LATAVASAAFFARFSTCHQHPLRGERTLSRPASDAAPAAVRAPLPPEPRAGEQDRRAPPKRASRVEPQGDEAPPGAGHNLRTGCT